VNGNEQRGISSQRGNPNDGDAYTLIPSGPRPTPDEAEIAGETALEVVILWDQTVLHVAHLSPPRAFYVGERSTKDGACDFVVPMEMLGTARAPIVLANDEWTKVVFLPGGRGAIEWPGEPTMTVAQAVDAGWAEPHGGVPGAYEILLPPGGKARMALGGLVFHVAAVAAGKPPAGALFGNDPTALLYSSLSLAAHASIFAAMAAFVPPLGITDREERDRDQRYLITQYLEAAAAREPEQKPADAIAEPIAESGGSPGARASGEEGSMGHPKAPAATRRYAVLGPEDNGDPRLARQAALVAAAEFGLIGVLHAVAGGDPNAPTALWGRDESLGNDPFSARGNMWGNTLGDALGGGAVGVSGTGEGGGGDSIGIGFDGIRTFDGGNGGRGDFQPFLGHPKVHETHALQMRPGTTTVSGGLPSEVIQRIVRQNYGRFRLCYQNGLRRNPSLEGRVAVRFVIGRDGVVSHANNGGSDLPDREVVECVIHAYYDLSFPAPDTGIVTVIYPIVFSPAG
jgi:hypothetical protein